MEAREKYEKFISEDSPIIENIIGYSFKNKKLLRQAFVHPSCRNMFADGDELEFIGDKILSTVLVYKNTKSIMKPDGTIGVGKELSKLNKTVGKRSQNKTLAENILRKNLLDYLIVAKNTKLTNSSKSVADLFEAIIGAIAIDTNWDIPKIESIYEGMSNSTIRGKGLLVRINSTKGIKK